MSGSQFLYLKIGVYSILAVTAKGDHSVFRYWNGELLEFPFH